MPRLSSARFSRWQTKLLGFFRQSFTLFARLCPQRRAVHVQIESSTFMSQAADSCRPVGRVKGMNAGADEIFRILVVRRMAVYQFVGDGHFASFSRDGSFLPNDHSHKTSYTLPHQPFSQVA